MKWVLLTAFAIGAATVIGSGIGFLVKEIPDRYKDAINGLSGGIMLCAAIIGLIQPAIAAGGKAGALICGAGIMCGALFLTLVNRLAPRLYGIMGIDPNAEINRKCLQSTFLFIVAMGIHHFPEGIAAGVSFGTGSVSDIVSVAGGIAIQNIPEGMIVIAPMLHAGISQKRTAAIALCIGLIEVLGTLFGYFAVTVAAEILPFALAFAGGTMLYVICDDVIPQTHGNGHDMVATYSTLAGFCLMLLLNFCIERMGG